MLILLFINQIYFIFICFLPFLEPPLKNSAKTTEDVFFLDLFMEKCPIPLEVSRLVASQNKRYNKAFVLKVKVCHLFYFYGVEIILLPPPLFHGMKSQKLEAGFEEGLASSVLDETRKENSTKDQTVHLPLQGRSTACLQQLGFVFQ